MKIKCLATVLLLTVLGAWPTLSRNTWPDAADPVLYAVLLDSSQELILGKTSFYYPSAKAMYAGEHFLGLLPLSLPLCALTHTPMSTLLGVQTALVLLLALSLYFLFFELCTSPWISALAASLTACSPWVLSVAYRPSVAGWFFLVWGLFFLIKLKKDPKARFAFAAGLCGTLQLLVSFNFAPVLLLAFGVILTANRQWLKSPALMTGLVLPWLPLVFFAQNYNTYTHSFEEVNRFAPQLRSFINPYPGYALPWPKAHFADQNLISEHALFPGWLILLGGLAGWCFMLKQKHHRIWLILGATAFVFALGPYPVGEGLPGPYAWLMKVFPPFRAFRAPGRLNLLLVLSLGIGLLFFLKAYWPKYAKPLSTLMILGLATGLWAKPQGISVDIKPNAVDLFLKEDAKGAVLELPVDYRLHYENIKRNTEFMYRARFHGHPISSGYGSFLPAASKALQTAYNAAIPLEDLALKNGFRFIRSPYPLSDFQQLAMDEGDYLYAVNRVLPDNPPPSSEVR